MQHRSCEITSLSEKNRSNLDKTGCPRLFIYTTDFNLVAGRYLVYFPCSLACFPLSFSQKYGIQDGSVSHLRHSVSKRSE